jgi:hypothetical protein
MYVMLRKSLSQACKDILQATREYDYAEYYKHDIITALTELRFVIHQLDRVDGDEELTRNEIRQIIEGEWLDDDASSEGFE